MKREHLLTLSVLADAVAGDPEWFPHPVRLIGWCIGRGERALRRPGQSALAEFALGAALTGGVVAGTYAATSVSLGLLRRRSPLLGEAADLLLGWTCLAARNLRDEAACVVRALAAEDLPLARRRLARIVGRDTADLDASEISRAVVETVAESASDGVVAPLFYLAVGGAPLAMAYKAVNTLDSMIGNADARYFYFGKAAARLDDAANFLPARLTAAALVAAAAASGQGRVAFNTWQQDGGLHKSPNAGQPEAAMSGALQVRLGGGNHYAGEWIAAAAIGGDYPPPAAADARRSVRLMAAATLLATAVLATAAMAAAAIAAGRRPREARL